MTEPEKPIHIEDDDATAGQKTGYMRYVLAFSLLLAIVAMSAIWLWPWLTGVTR